MARFKEVYDDPRWEPARRFVLARDNGLCQLCQAHGLIHAGNEVDHITELTDENKDDPEIAFNPENLRTLCAECHNLRHGRGDNGLKNFIVPLKIEGIDS